MKNLIVTLAMFPLLLVSATEAAAQERPPVAERPASEPKSQEAGGIAPGYQVEAGAASTRVSKGSAKFATKTTPTTEDLAMLRVSGMGPGQLTIGSTFYAALASAAGQPTSSMEVDPQAFYGGRVGPVHMGAGFKLTLLPRAADVDAAYEGIARFSVPNRFVTPTLEVLPELVQKRGFYSVFGLERSFKIASWLSIKPRGSLGEQGYEVKSERPHFQDLTGSVQVKADITDTFYALVRPAASYLTGPDHFYKDPSFGGRSVAYLAFAIGAQH
jgi:hypothetical protein